MPGAAPRAAGHPISPALGRADGKYGAGVADQQHTETAVLALSRSLRAGFAGHGVGVTAICPAVTNTPIVHKTRYLGDQADEQVRARSKKLFDRGHPPAKVATAIVRAIERDRSVVPVGVESWLGWWFNRYLPVRAHQALVSKLPLT